MGSGSVARPPTPSEARATESVNVFTPMVNSAMRMAGMSTPHGLAIRPTRFSLIISPQLAAGGCRPKPRKLSPAMTSME